MAARLTKAITDRTAITRLTEDHPELDLATAYRVQDELRREAGAIVGWKLGVTSRAKQAQVGVDCPVYGFLPGTAVLDIGEPLITSHQIQPRCEPEIVFILGRDLAGEHVNAVDVLAASAGVAVGIEVLDSRYAGYDFTMADVVADNTSAARFVVGTPVPITGIDLRLVGVVLEKNGKVAATAASSCGQWSTGRRRRAVRWPDGSRSSSGGRRRRGVGGPPGVNRAQLPVDIATAETNIDIR
jgi:2-keto-4-pentenoate hydratase